MKNFIRNFLSVALSLLFLPVASFAQDAMEQSSSSSASKRSTQQIEIVQQVGMEVRGDFQIGPGRFVLEMNPGEQRSITVEVTSREGEPRLYDIEVEDFAVSNDEKSNMQFYGNGTGPFSAKSWVRPSVPSFSLRHGERAFVPVRISIPANAAVGDHYAAVFFKRRVEDASKGGFNMVSRVGALLLITVKGDVVRQGELEKFETERSLYWSLPARFMVQYRNAGTVHIVPAGSVEISNIFGIPVDEIAIKDWYVLRNSVRRRDILWQPHFALGYYKATLNIAVAGENIAPMTQRFWILPVVPVVIALLAIFGVSFLVQVFFNRFELRRKK